MKAKSPSNGPLLNRCPPRPKNRIFTNENRLSYNRNLQKTATNTILVQDRGRLRLGGRIIDFAYMLNRAREPLSGPIQYLRVTDRRVLGHAVCRGH